MADRPPFRPTTRALLILLAVAASLAPTACGTSTPDERPVSSAAPAADPAPTPASSAPRVVFLGDSLTAGYGLSAAADAYPGLIGRRLREAGYPHEVVNAGVSGDTTAGGLRRVDWSLQGDVRVLVVALGGNDALRGLAPAEMRQNLSLITAKAKSKGARVLLAGMEAPPNFGPAYTREFRSVYPAVAKEQGVPLVPFLLEGVAGVPALNQGDGIHPTVEGQRVIADNVWRHLEPLLAAGSGT